jgi:hypothetical protein
MLQFLARVIPSPAKCPDRILTLSKRRVYGVPGLLLLGKAVRREAEKSLPSSAWVKVMELYFHPTYGFVICTGILGHIRNAGKHARKELDSFVMCVHTFLRLEGLGFH